MTDTRIDTFPARVGRPDARRPTRAGWALTTLREQGLFLGIVAVYLAARLAFNPSGRPIDPALLATIAAAIGFVTALVLPVRILLRVRPPGGGVPALRDSARAWRQAARRFVDLEAVLRAAVLCAGVSVLYAVYLEWKADIGIVLPFSWDPRFAELDRWIHLGRHPWELLEGLSAVPFWLPVIDVIYQPGWSFIAFGSVAVMAWSPDPVRRQRFFLVYATSWILLGTVFAYGFASAGPVYFGQVTTAVNPFLPLVEQLETAGATSVRSAQGLWHAYAVEAWPRVGISAMPSMHVAMATVIALATWGAGRRARLAGVAFLLAIGIGSVQLAWHYAIDTYFSVLAVGALWWLSGRWIGIRRGDSGPHADPGAS